SLSTQETEYSVSCVEETSLPSILNLFQRYPIYFTLHKILDGTSFQYINKLKKSIYVVDNDGQYKLNTELNLEFLKEHFPMLEWDYINNITFSKKYEFQQMPKQNILHLESKHDLEDRVFSFAVTGQQEAQMTIYR
ncbi:hypothetical protein HPK02_13400, partial [Anoxybacillus flavithermus]|uniref:hypothetical protein n=1 Tax=Anoxybacillus flavithermus TaxID=33934 RepID=UPI0018689194